ncbi:MAG: type IV pilus assembly protein PilM [Candidatus Omnitrophica bacterium]|nr:type IV pilus assembly protein PilM [Candidatus Omnitrophota bacterium]MDD5573783.1 type IV pilus assembly protein PilM [Candidatus Omnitrophota bacterium]
MPLCLFDVKGNDLMKMDPQQLKHQLDESLASVRGLIRKNMPQPEVDHGTWGMDIGTDAVKICRLDTAKKPFTLLAYAVERVDQKNVRDALSRALSNAGAPQDACCVLSVSGQGSVTRYVELPAMSKSELESSMKFEIEKYVPFPMAEVVTDYVVAGEMKDKAKMSVLIAAAKNELIQKKFGIAQEMGLRTRAMDLDALALANFYSEIISQGKGEPCCAVINMGKTSCNMDIFVDGQPFLSRDIFVGGDDFTKKIAEVLELDFAEAEKLKCGPSGREEEVSAAWDPVLSNLTSEIRVSLDYFESRGDKAVGLVLITGGASRLYGVREYLEHALAVDVKHLAYGERLRLGEGIDRQAFAADSGLLAVALGLALRENHDHH